MTYPGYGPDRRREAVELYVQGYSAVHVAHALGVGVSFVLEAARHAGVVRRPAHLDPRGGGLRRAASVSITSEGAPPAAPGLRRPEGSAAEAYGTAMRVLQW